MSAINLKLPDNIILKPTITVFGVGGAGGNAVNNMIKSELQGVTFVTANTDAQALEHSLSINKIQLGITTTKGLGAGASPDVGMAAAEESEAEIREYLNGSNMVFITAGMGGGTGTGAAPVVARLAKEIGILTVGVVTKPFHFEGQYRMKLADFGLSELQKYVDTLIVIPNQNLFYIANERTTFAEAFKMADEVLGQGVRGITDLMINPGLINLDFADIRTVMSAMGKAMMGTGEASGSDERAIKAADLATANPLLDHGSVKGAKAVIINITGGMDMTLFEVDAAASRVREKVEDADANIIFGSTFDPNLDGIIRVSVVATGIESNTPSVTDYKNDIASSFSTTVNNSSPNLQSISHDEESKPSAVISSQGVTSPPIISNSFEKAVEIAKDHVIQPVINNTTEEVKTPLVEPSAQTNSSTSQYVQNPIVKPKEASAQPQVISAIVPVKNELAEHSKPKMSLFSRMISSITTAEKPAPLPNQHTPVSPIQSSSTNSKLSQKSDTATSTNETTDIYDVPAFLRRR